MEGGYRVSVCVYWKCTPSWEITTLPSSLTVYMLSIPGILTLMWWTFCASSPAQNFCSQTVRQVYVQVLRRRNVSFCGLITVARIMKKYTPSTCKMPPSLCLYESMAHTILHIDYTIFTNELFPSGSLSKSCLKVRMTQCSTCGFLVNTLLLFPLPTPFTSFPKVLDLRNMFNKIYGRHK